MLSSFEQPHTVLLLVLPCIINVPYHLTGTSMIIHSSTFRSYQRNPDPSNQSLLFYAIILLGDRRRLWWPKVKPELCTDDTNVKQLWPLFFPYFNDFTTPNEYLRQHCALHTFLQFAVISLDKLLYMRSLLVYNPQIMAQHYTISMK